MPNLCRSADKAAGSGITVVGVVFAVLSSGLRVQFTSAANMGVGNVQWIVAPINENCVTACYANNYMQCSPEAIIKVLRDAGATDGGNGSAVPTNNRTQRQGLIDAFTDVCAGRCAQEAREPNAIPADGSALQFVGPSDLSLMSWLSYVDTTESCRVAAAPDPSTTLGEICDQPPESAMYRRICPCESRLSWCKMWRNGWEIVSTLSTTHRADPVLPHALQATTLVLHPPYRLPCIVAPCHQH